MKKTILFTLLASCFAVSVSAQQQQLTRFAVVDLPRVYAAFSLESHAMVQAEIDRRTLEIRELQTRHAELVSQGDHVQAQRLEADISRRTEALREYYTLRTAQLEDQRRRLASEPGSFMTEVTGEIRRIAEADGYSMVFNVRENATIIWYSMSVDITERVIQNLTARR